MLLTRRDFVRHTAALAGAALIGTPSLFAAEAGATKRTAVDQVPLGKTGLKLSRLGIGTGTNSGNVQKALGKEAFERLIKYAYDKGITYIDTAQSYATFDWIAGAIRGLPREKLFIQSKIPGQPPNVLEAIDRHRKVFNTDYIDSMLIHCMSKTVGPTISNASWTDSMKRNKSNGSRSRACRVTVSQDSEPPSRRHGSRSTSFVSIHKPNISMARRKHGISREQTCNPSWPKSGKCVKRAEASSA